MSRPLIGLALVTSLAAGSTALAKSTAIPSLNNPQENYYYIPSGQGPGYGVNIAGGLIHPSANPAVWEVNNGQSGAPPGGEALLAAQLATNARILARAAELQRLFTAPAPKIETMVKAGDVVEFDMTGLQPTRYEERWGKTALSYHNFYPGLPVKVIGGVRHASVDGGKTWGKVVQLPNSKINGGWYIEVPTQDVKTVGPPIPVGKVQAEFREGKGGLEVRVAELGVDWKPLPTPIAGDSSSGKIHQYAFHLGDAQARHSLVLQTMGSEPERLQLIAHGWGQGKTAAGVLQRSASKGSARPSGRR
jgi:hypothetical protein